MLTFLATVSDAELLDAVRRWSDALAAGDAAAAFAMTYHARGDLWTPEQLAWVARSYDDGAEDRSLARITPWASAAVADVHPTHSVTWYDEPNPRRSPPVVGDISADLPYRGRWSDVTALFNILRLGDRFVLQLETVHIM